MQYKKDGYSVVAAILIVGFLFVVSSGIFQLVLTELNDNRGRENYLRASAGAEAALELALLWIKQNGYGYFDQIDTWANDRSILLSKTPLDLGGYKWNDVRISFRSDSKIQSYSGSLDPIGFDIIPLFFLDSGDSPENKATSLSLDAPDNLSWNLVSTNGGVSGQWPFTKGDTVSSKIVTSDGAFGFSDSESIESFLASDLRSTNYLILFNPDSSQDIEYRLFTSDDSEFFTKPRTEIISSAQVGKYKQNFRTVVDNTEYLNVLKYSIFSN